MIFLKISFKKGSVFQIGQFRSPVLNIFMAHFFNWSDTACNSELELEGNAVNKII